MPLKYAHYSFNYLTGAIDGLKENISLEDAPMSRKIALAILIAFTYESFLNHAGNQRIRSWGDHLKKKLSPEGKLALLCELGNTPVDFGKSPFQTFREVFAIRNLLAHAETEYMDVPITSNENAEDFPRPVWLIKLNTLKFQRSLDDMKEIMKTIESSLDIEPIPDFLLGAAVGTRVTQH
jgi:hypothetical protein